MMEANADRSIIKVNTFSVETVKALLEFIYTNVLSNHRPRGLTARLGLIRAADYYQVPNLYRLVANQILEKDWHPSSMMEILSVAMKYKGICDVLAVHAGEYVREIWNRLMLVEEFWQSTEGMDPGLLKDLYTFEIKGSAYIQKEKRLVSNCKWSSAFSCLRSGDFAFIMVALADWNAII